MPARTKVGEEVCRSRKKFSSKYQKLDILHTLARCICRESFPKKKQDSNISSDARRPIGQVVRSNLLAPRSSTEGAIWRSLG